LQGVKWHPPGGGTALHGVNCHRPRKGTGLGRARHAAHGPPHASRCHTAHDHRWGGLAPARAARLTTLRSDRCRCPAARLSPAWARSDKTSATVNRSRQVPGPTAFRGSCGRFAPRRLRSARPPAPRATLHLSSARAHPWPQRAGVDRSRAIHPVGISNYRRWGNVQLVRVDAPASPPGRRGMRV